jgi:hypothetical protein
MELVGPLETRKMGSALDRHSGRRGNSLFQELRDPLHVRNIVLADHHEHGNSDLFEPLDGRRVRTLFGAARGRGGVAPEEHRANQLAKPAVYLVERPFRAGQPRLRFDARGLLEVPALQSGLALLPAPLEPWILEPIPIESGIHEEKCGHAIRTLECEIECDASPHRSADQGRTLDPEVIQDRPEIAEVRVRSWRHGTLSEPAQVVGRDAELAGEIANLRSPHPAVRNPGVEEHEVGSHPRARDHQIPDSDHGRHSTRGGRRAAAKIRATINGSTSGTPSTAMAGSRPTLRR